MSTDLPRGVFVFFHGALNDHSVWSPLIEPLRARGHTVIAPDLPGHGDSPGPQLYAIEDMSAWTLALLKERGVEQAVVAGHSMGSLVALDLAARAPERVAALALLGTGWPMTVSPALLEMALEDEAKAIGLVAKWSHRPQAPEREQSLRLMESVAAANRDRLLYTDLKACDAYAGGEQAARQVACPTLFVIGAQDKMTPPASTALLRAAMPQARTVELDAGHQMMVEAPEAVLSALLTLEG